MKNKIITFVDVVVRILFAVFGVYLLTKYNSDNTVKFAGYSIIIFNIISPLHGCDEKRDSKTWRRMVGIA